MERISLSIREGAVGPEPHADHAADREPAPMHLGDTEAVENGKHVAPEPLHGIGALRDVRFAVAATVVAHEPEVARERRHLVRPQL